MNDDQEREMADAVRSIADQLGISVEQAMTLTWNDLLSISTQARARIDQDLARTRDLDEITSIVERYPDAMARCETMGEVVDYMSGPDAQRFRTLADRVEAGQSR